MITSVQYIIYKIVVWLEDKKIKSYIFGCPLTLQLLLSKRERDRWKKIERKRLQQQNNTWIIIIIIIINR